MVAKLETLPPELLFNVLSYCNAFDTRSLPEHPLFAVAATCHQLHDHVEEFTRALLKKYARKPLPKRSKRVVALTCRKSWLKYLSTVCSFCWKKTVSRAILDAKMTCCRNCDRKEFRKMTMTAALKDHRLSKLDLFTPNMLYPTLPPLSTGQYSVMGGEATMIATPDVLARKAHIATLLGPAKAENDKFMRSRCTMHSSLILITEQFTESGEDPNTVVWRRMPRTISITPSNQILGAPPRIGGGRTLWYFHKKAAKILKNQWEDMGNGMEIGELPGWAVKQLFGERCDNAACLCVLLEGSE